MFRFIHGYLLTNAQLAHFTNENPYCAFCNRDYFYIRNIDLGDMEGPAELAKETIRHLVCHCMAAKKKFPTLQNSILDFFLNTDELTLKKLWCKFSALANLLADFWKLRNSLLD